MTKLHFVKKARKARRKYGIKKGDSYYWYKFYGKGQPIRYSLTKPKRSQYATRNPHLGVLMDLEDEFHNGVGDDPAEVRAMMESAQLKLEDIIQELERSVENMGERFPSGCPTLELLTERLEAVRELQLAVSDAAEMLDEDADADKVREALDSINWEYS